MKFDYAQQHDAEDVCFDGSACAPPLNADNVQDAICEALDAAPGLPMVRVKCEVIGGCLVYTTGGILFTSPRLCQLKRTVC